MVKTREIGVVALNPQGPLPRRYGVVDAPPYNESGTKRIGRLDLFRIITDPAEESVEKANMA